MSLWKPCAFLGHGRDVSHAACLRTGNQFSRCTRKSASLFRPTSAQKLNNLKQTLCNQSAFGCAHAHMLGRILLVPLCIDRSPKFEMFFTNASNTFRTIEPYRPLSLKPRETLSQGTPALSHITFQQAIADVRNWNLGRRPKAEKLRHQFRTFYFAWGTLHSDSEVGPKPRPSQSHTCT